MCNSVSVFTDQTVSTPGGDDLITRIYLSGQLFLQCSQGSAHKIIFKCIIIEMGLAPLLLISQREVSYTFSVRFEGPQLTQGSPRTIALHIVRIPRPGQKKKKK